MAAPTLTGFVDPNPCPRVLVSFGALAAGTVTVTVQRTAEGRTMRVRGGINLYASGGAVVMDYECPFGVLTTYQAEQFDTNGLSLGFTGSTPIILTVGQAWIHQPLNPSLAITARIFIDSANDISRPTPGGVVWPEGATVGRLIGGQRQGIHGMALRLRMGSAADADKFLSMFGSYATNYPAVLCIRTPPGMRLPRVLFAGILDPHEVDYGVYAMITMAMTVDEVSPPAPGLVMPTLRRKDIDAAYPTRSARAAAYPTRLARDSDYSLRASLGPWPVRPAG